MKRLTTYTIQLISGLLLALLTAGCVADRNVSDCITEGEDVELEFALQVPALETSLRQLDANQEKQIKSIQVLVFNTDGINDEAQETFAYEAPVRNFETSTADGYTRIRCKLTSTAKPMRVVCIANANINTQGFANKTKGVILNEDVMKELFTEKWATDGSKFIYVG
ncbi:fimbrial protein [Porphyromonas uenonis]|uniref:fimbrial protein n=1 Tax=Porphyromonas uenonis TaxID=281920 RepID=UPI000472A48D|nr:fimbrial protein [Porphyromonas uenonis]